MWLFLLSASAQAFRPPSVPLLTGEPLWQAHLFADTSTGDVARFWDGREQELTVLLRTGGSTYRLLGACRDQACAPALEQSAVTVDPLRTVFSLVKPGDFAVELALTSPLLPQDLELMSRPIHYVTCKLTSLDRAPRNGTLLVAASAEHIVNSDAAVRWEATGRWAWIGRAKQDVLSVKGDKKRADWGWLYARAPRGQHWAGSLANAKARFLEGALPDPDTRQPRLSSNDLPGVVAYAPVAPSGTVLLGYDDIVSIDYFGLRLSGLWSMRRNWTALLDVAEREEAAVLARVQDHDRELLLRLEQAGGSGYAQLAALAFRQTLSALKVVWHPHRKEAWVFLKEISTNGDLSTMDVIFPASPLLLAENPVLLRQLLIPVLVYASNGTSVRFTDPYSPHQLGKYPIANARTEDQEPMPLENSGNMLLMLLALAQRGDAGWLWPFWPMLEAWARELERHLPFPAKQLSTDDFMGAFPNNTNLAAKGIIALRAFDDLCGKLKAPCRAGVAPALAQRWQAAAFSSPWPDSPHYAMQFNNPRSYSLKYNFVWQKLLRLEGPFDPQVWRTEVAYYLRARHAFGPVLESRVSPFRTSVKLDWLAWAACLADSDDDFHGLFDPIVAMANVTLPRSPLPDLYDTLTGLSFPALAKSFVNRPVVGAVYARLLLQQPSEVVV